jgi:histidinol phosphatase-like PHP family hydrolase
VAWQAEGEMLQSERHGPAHKNCGWKPGVLKAVANPYTTILGHMTGRQLLRRPGYDIDVKRVLAACAHYGAAVEINANPWRPSHERCE